MKHLALLTLTVLMAGCSYRPVWPQDEEAASSVSSDASSSAEDSSSMSSEARATEWVMPLPNAAERVTKKPFGILIDPKTSPVQPERFSGYHSGTDFEILDGEKDADVAVSAVCSGTVSFAGSISGYGGVLVEKCVMDGQTVTVLYGHLRLSSIAAQRGATLAAGDFVANLGTGFSDETDRERKHLHLSIHRGAAIEYRGYSATEEGLGEWIDPMTVLR